MCRRDTWGWDVLFMAGRMRAGCCTEKGGVVLLCPLPLSVGLVICRLARDGAMLPFFLLRGSDQ